MKRKKQSDNIVTKKKVQFVKLYKKAFDFDVWGQSEEAIKSYRSVLAAAKMVLKECGNNEVVTITHVEKLVLSRIDVLNLKNTAPKDLSSDDMESLYRVLVQVLLKKNTTSKKKLLSPSCRRIITKSESSSSQDRTHEKLKKMKSKSVFSTPSLLPVLACKPGTKTLIIVIEKIGMKDAQSYGYVEPHFRVSEVRDGKIIGKGQETYIPDSIFPMYIKFHCPVHIQQTLRDLGSTSKIFFEFKHYVKKKKEFRVRCWAVLEMDEIKNGKVSLELYKPPTRWNLKKFRLYTVKPLYLHLEIKILQH